MSKDNWTDRPVLSKRLKNWLTKIEMSGYSTTLEGQKQAFVAGANAALSSQWQSADNKPEHNVGVLVFIPDEDNHITSGMWDIDNKWVLLDEYRVPDCEVTHWMPLPSPPLQQKQ